MRTSKVLSVSLPAEMLRRVETLAKAEDRTRSELVREALRVYEDVQRQNRKHVPSRLTATAGATKRAR